MVYHNSGCYSLSLIMFYTCPNFKAPDFLSTFNVDIFEYITCSESRNSGKSATHRSSLASWILNWPSCMLELS